MQKHGGVQRDRQDQITWNCSNQIFWDVGMYGEHEIQELFEEVEGNSETAASSVGTVPA